MAVLSQFEETVNDSLAEFDIHVQGLRGDWLVTNPVLHVERIETAFGSLSGVEMEIAVIESLVRNQFIARRVQVEDIDLEFDLQTKRTEIDFWDILQRIQSTRAFFSHSDELEFRATVSVKDELEQRSWEIWARGSNVSGIHRFYAEVTSLDNSDSTMVFQSNAVDTLFDLRPVDYQMVLSANEFTVDMPLLTQSRNFPPLVINSRGQWQRKGGQTKGHVDATLTTIAETPVSLQADIAIHKDGDSPTVLTVDETTLTTGTSSVDLALFRLGLSSTALIGTSSAIVLDDLHDAVITVTADNENLSQWIANLNGKGTLYDFEFVLDDDGFGWYGNLRNGSLDAYLRFPKLELAEAKLFGSLSQFLVDMRAVRGFTHLETLFRYGWELGSISGTALIERGKQHMAVHATDLLLHLTADAEVFAEPAKLKSEQRVVPDEFVREPIDAVMSFSLMRALGGPPDFQVAVALDFGDALIPLAQTPEFTGSKRLCIRLSTRCTRAMK